MSTVDLGSCELEPIQFPGAIQPYGSLVAFKEGAARLLWWSEDIPSHPLMPLRLEDIVAFGAGGLFRGAALNRPSVVLDRDGGSWRLSPHLHAGNLVVEIERVVEESVEEVRALQYGLAAMVSEMQEAASVRALCEAGARWLREITGYDRVMVYRFHADAHGEVIAEARDPALRPFLGLHYPASDIPAQARALFISNSLRMIADVEYRPVPLHAAAGALGPLDLGRTLMRSVSPIHLEYLRNMEVRASLTVSILNRGKLWGLIACHHCVGPKNPGPEVRAACELAGKLLSSLLAIKRDEETASSREHAQEKLLFLTAPLAEEDDLGRALLAGTPSVLDLFAAGGAAATVYNKNNWRLIGKTPTLAQVQALAAFFRTRAQEDLFQTDCLARLYPPAAEFADVASGLLALSFPGGQGDFVFWFRPAIVQTVSWGGNPGLPAIEEQGQLHPRHSFAEWKQSVRDTASPWQDWELAAAFALRIEILALGLRAQVRKEQAARRDAEAANQTTQDLMAVVSHDLRNPLNAIGINVALIRRTIEAKQIDRADDMLARIERATARMKRLIEDLLEVAQVESGNIVLSPESVDCGALLEETADIIAPLAGDKQIQLRVLQPEGALRARCERERILQVLSNLAGNAIKFTPNGGAVTIGARLEKGECVFFVEDTGPGVARENFSRVFDRFWQAKETRLLGTGLGLAISKGIVSAHGGRIWVESEPGQGARFFFTLSLAG